MQGTQIEITVRGTQVPGGDPFYEILLTQDDHTPIVVPVAGDSNAAWRVAEALFHFLGANTLLIIRVQC